MSKEIIHTWVYQGLVHTKYRMNGKKYIDKFTIDWCFYIDLENSTKAYNLLKTIVGTVTLLAEGNYIKVIPQKMSNENLVLLFEQNGIPTYEGDLVPDKFWYVNTDIKIATQFSKLYIDIETDDSQHEIKVGKDRILSFAAVDDKGKTYFISEEDEAGLLTKVLQIVKHYDLVIGWNIMEFDLPYLRERMVKYGLHQTNLYCWREVGKYDLLKRFRHIFRFDSHIKNFSLEYVSQHFLGKGKVPLKTKKIDLYRTDKALLEKYNLEDCTLVKELDEKLGVSDMMIRQSQWCQVPPSKFGLYSIIDSYIIRKAHSVGKYVRTSLNAIKERTKKHYQGNVNPDETETTKSKYIGAIVLTPVTGKYDRVYTFDFKGLYPSMMRTSNVGYDSLLLNPGPNCITNPGTLTIPRLTGEIKPTYFKKDLSVINLAISDLITKRTEYKDLKLKMIEEGTNTGREWEKVVSDEIIVKELANSTYGIMGLEYGRYYSIDVAESITLFGQWCIGFAKSFFEEQGYKVIYGDTDSVFVSTGKAPLDIEDMRTKFHDSLEKELKKYNISESFIQLNFDKEYDSFLLIAKKTYVGHVINMEGKKTNELYARGLEFHKKNTFSFAATKQKELINLLLSGVDKPGLYEWARKTREEFFSREFTKDELVLTQRVGKRVGDYVKTPPLHVRLAQVIHQKTGVDLYRSEVDYIITKSDGLMDGVLSGDFDGTFDRKYYWTNKTVPILERVVKIVYPDSSFFDDNLTLF